MKNDAQAQVLTEQKEGTPAGEQKIGSADTEEMAVLENALTEAETKGPTELKNELKEPPPPKMEAEKVAQKPVEKTAQAEQPKQKISKKLSKLDHLSIHIAKVNAQMAQKESLKMGAATGKIARGYYRLWIRESNGYFKLLVRLQKRRRVFQKKKEPVQDVGRVEVA